MFLLWQNATVLLREISSTLLEPWIYLFNARVTKSKICCHEPRKILEKDLICVTLIVFTRVMVSESSLCNSRNHDWLHKTYWQIHPTRAEIFQRNNHTWCQRKQLITVNIYECFLWCDDLCAGVLVIRTNRGCKDSQGPHHGFDGCYKQGIPVEMPHNCLD